MQQTENIEEAEKVSIIFSKRQWNFTSTKEIQELGNQTTAKSNIVKHIGLGAIGFGMRKETLYLQLKLIKSSSIIKRIIILLLMNKLEL